MAKDPRTTPAPTPKHRAARQARLTTKPIDDGDCTRTGLPSERQDDANTTIMTSSSTLPRRVTNAMLWPSKQLPPAYDELFPPAGASLSGGLVKSRPWPSPPKGMDPLVAAMWHNENLSLMLSLPDKLLLKIIERLDNTGIECIRRVARRFPPLCVREILSPRRGNDQRLCEAGPFNWPTSGISSYLRPRFLELIDRDEYCSGCQAARKSPQWEERLSTLTEYIHCSACGADHPACLFSATQRLKPARLRYCIGHEGFMRVCDHKDGTLRLSSILLMSLRQSGSKTGEPWETPLCKDPSHRIPCKKLEGGSFPKPKRGCESHMGLCIPYRWLSIVGHEKDPDNREIFDIHWTAHVPFDGRMDKLRPKLAAIRENVGKYIVPCLATSKEPPELRCFDPNDCHCITYAGSDNVRWEWECGPWLPGTTQCISDPFKGLNTLQPPREPSSTISNVIRRLRSKPPPQCPADQKLHQSRLEERPPTRGVGRCGVDIRPCHTGRDCLKVEYVRAIRPQCNGKITPQWYNTLEQDSYNIMDDQDGLGVYWCLTPGCRNYHKGLPNYAGILRRHEFRKECRH